MGNASLEPLPIYASPILIVDDNEINRIFLEKALESRGFTKLLAVESAEIALREMDRFKPELVILDIMMPVMDGFECCKRIRRMPRGTDLPILIQTTLTEPEMRVKAFKCGATDFVSKPIYPDELYARVMVHLEKRILVENLKTYKMRIEQELESARQLQYAILPQPQDVAKIEQSCRLNIASHYQPSSEIGGDFWGMKDLFPHQTALWLVDFSGHGVASALNAFRLQAYLKEHSPLAARPGEYLSHLNDKLLHLLLRGQFATMFYGIVDTQGNKLLYACACSPHPIIIRKSTGQAEMLDGSGTPLGIALQLYPTHSVTFSAGDMLLLYSDALIETPNEAGEFITEEEIIKLLIAYKGAAAAEVKEVLLDYFQKHTGGVLTDDLTIAICIRSALE